MKKIRPADKYTWTPDMDDQLRQAYRRSSNRLGLSAELTKLCSMFRLPRTILSNRARKLGLNSFHPSKPWDAKETLALREFAGQVSVTAIAKKLKRSPDAVRNQLFRMEQSAAVTEGYTIRQLQLLLGVPNRSIQVSLTSKALKMRQDRITEASVRKFVRNNMYEYSFRRADEPCLKSMLTTATAEKPQSRLDMRDAA
jgi:hypothetical protein